MKRQILIALTALMTFAMVTPSQAQKARKLPEGAYLKSAKIEILSKDPARRETAVALLDSLFMYYGPHAEGQYLMAQISIDKLNEAKDFEAQQQAVDQFNRWHAELTQTCANEAIKQKYRDGCKEHAELIDSLVVLYSRQFYNDGVEKLNRVHEASDAMKTEQDSSALAFYKAQIASATDSVIQVLTLAVKLDSTQDKPYVGIAQAYQAKGENDKSIEWLERGIPYAQDPEAKNGLILQVAFNYAQAEKFCEAIAPFKEYVAMNPNDTAILYNLSICYIRCKMPDSAVGVYHQMLAIDPNHPDALVGIGRYWNTVGRARVDSMQHAADAKRESDAKAFSASKDQAFDSAKVYLQRAFDVSPLDKGIAYEYGITAYIVNDFQAATTAFQRLVELDPQSLDAWISLGDSHLNLKDWKQAANAYEKAVAISPEKKELWERLSGLYAQLGEKTKQAEADRKSK